MSDSNQNPNVSIFTLSKTLLSLTDLSLSRKDDGSVVLTGKKKDGTEEVHPVFSPFIVPGKSKVVPPSDLSGRSWEVIVHLGSGTDPKKSRIYTMKEGGRGRPIIVSNGDPKKNLTIWIGTVETLQTLGYIVHMDDPSLDVWTLSDKGRSSLVPRPVGTVVPPTLPSTGTK